MTDAPDSYARLPALARADPPLSDVQMEICRRLMDGESLVSICRDDHMPGRSTVFEWLTRDAQFHRAYVLAKQLLAEVLAEEILQIADDASGDFVEGEHGRKLDREHVERSRLRVDSRKWLSAKLAPKRYGDATSVRMGLLDEGRRAASELSQDEVVVRLMSILDRAQKRKG